MSFDDSKELSFKQNSRVGAISVLGKTNFMKKFKKSKFDRNLFMNSVDGIKLGKKIESEDGRFIYHISIIDYLQKYDFNKKVERFYKINVNGAKRK